ncbi:unnamed protein product [Strongylus vulgaris]|uniref:Uncharacterized protein n=1 Tax=Strongylus vulgaris TaxID=40348 RepID=A0A3P7IIU6_STRVU|nr:unnamed protein product [Strongylus vulgaris]
MQEITGIFKVRRIESVLWFDEKVFTVKQKHPNFIFQQDWAPDGAKTIHFLKTKINFFLTEDLWPANSPDLIH